MKKLLLTIVLVKQIAVPTEQFNLDELQTLAESSLEIGGFIQPPVVRRNGTGYEIIAGHKQVAAAHLAKLIDPRNGESIPVMLLEPEMEEAAALQLPASPEPTETPTAPAAETPATQATEPPAPIERAFHYARLTIQQLKKLAKEKGIIPRGDKRLKTTYINALKLAPA
ncbi:ParB/RepB/Spo0J family partition protein [Microcoleus sp. Pol11C1]|uniref:ParB/RepB/Spo0J family partition protein n=1 Tax=unclassified Microcoleus TaxID=2642155 RepID=UPI002FCF58BD